MAIGGKETIFYSEEMGFYKISELFLSSEIYTNGRFSDIAFFIIGFIFKEMDTLS